MGFWHAKKGWGFNAMNNDFLFPAYSLDEQLVKDLRRMNPWWEGRALPVLPKTRRHLVAQMQKRLTYRMAPILVVRGSRQIGKTTAQLQMIQDLLNQGIEPNRILRVQFDEIPTLHKIKEPILSIVEWYEHSVLGESLNDTAQKQKMAYLFFDEVQNLSDWAPQLKNLVDNSTTHVLVTGSSALRIEAGRDSLAGRIHTLQANVLSLTEIALFHGLGSPQPYLKDNGLDVLTSEEFWRGLEKYGQAHQELRDESFHWFAERGGYPLVHEKKEVPWNLLADQLNENIIKRVIQHDLRIGEKGNKRDPKLLEELFRICCRQAGRNPSVNSLVEEIKSLLAANVGSQRINAYLRFLSETLLIHLVQPLEIRLKRTKSSPKICLADHALRASWLQEYIPLEPDKLKSQQDLSTLAGHLVESIIGSTLSAIGGLDLAYLPEKANHKEIDFVITVGDKRIPVEVKYQNKPDFRRDIEGVVQFLDKKENRAAFGLIITQKSGFQPSDNRVIPISLPDFLMLR